MKSLQRIRRIGGVSLSTLAVLILVACSKEPESAQTPHVRYVVGLSPFLDENSGNKVFRHIAQFLLEDMPLNSSLWIYDAYNIRTVTRMEVPNRRAFVSSRTRANQFSKPMQQLKSFLAARHAPPEVDNLEFDHVVRLPQFMDFIGDNLQQTNASTVALVLGSPLYQDEKETTFSMRRDYFPSDGHLLATREQSVYGRAGVTNNLADISVFLGHLDEPWASDLHRQKIGRFWNLFLSRQGATLGALTGDLPTIFGALKQGLSGLDGTAGVRPIDASANKIEMIRVMREVPLSDFITRELPSDHRPPPPTTSVGPMKIGIRWTGDIDVDLYAKAASRSEVLYFDHTEVEEGYYYKDHRSSPDREYEFIEFTQPVRVHDVLASVNFYQGRSPGGVRGEVRVEFEGRIYAGRFQLTAERGNRGRAGRGQEPYWQEIDIPTLLGLD